MDLIHKKRKAKGFSLVEVVLAIGIFALAVVALLGLLGPTLESVQAVRDQNKATAIISKVNTFLQTYEPSLDGIDESRFNYFYEELVDDDEIVLLAWFDEERPEGHYINFVDDPQRMNDTFTELEKGVSDGVVFKIVLEPSRFYERYPDYSSGQGQPINLPGSVDDYPEGFLAFSVSVYSGPVPEPGVTISADDYGGSSTDIWTERLVYNAAINR